MRMDFDIRGIEIGISEIAKTSSRSASEAINSRMYFFMLNAMKATKRASRAAIESLGLKTKSMRQRFTSQGKLRTVRKFDFEAERAITAYLGATKHKTSAYRAWALSRKYANREELEDAAKKWIGKKLRSIGFLASCFRPAIRFFDKFSAQKGTISKDARYYAGIKGINKRAHENRLDAIGGFSVRNDKYGNELRPYAQNLLRESLAKGYAIERAEFKRHLEDKLKKDLRSKGFEVR